MTTFFHKLYSIGAFFCAQTAEGHRAQLAYEKALKDGYVKVYRGRIILIGQDRAGKTSLKKSLLGLPFDPKEQSTEGIEVDPSRCEIDVDQIKNWHSTSENKPGLLECSKDVAKMVGDNLCNQKDYLKGKSLKNFKEDFKDGSFQNDTFGGGNVRLADEDGNIFQSKQV